MKKVHIAIAEANRMRSRVCDGIWSDDGGRKRAADSAVDNLVRIIEVLVRNAEPLCKFRREVEDIGRLRLEYYEKDALEYFEKMEEVDD